MDQNTDCSKLTAQGCNEGMSYMFQTLWAVISNLLEHIPEYSHDKSNKAKKFIITHQFTQPTDFEYQTSVHWCKICNRHPPVGALAYKREEVRAGRFTSHGH